MKKHIKRFIARIVFAFGGIMPGRNELLAPAINERITEATTYDKRYVIKTDREGKIHMTIELTPLHSKLKIASK